MPVDDSFAVDPDDVPDDPVASERRQRLKYAGYALWAVVIFGVLGLAVLTGTGLGETLGVWEATGMQPPIQDWHLIYQTSESSVTVGFSLNGDSLFRYTVGV